MLSHVVVAVEKRRRYDKAMYEWNALSLMPPTLIPNYDLGFYMYSVREFNTVVLRGTVT